MKILYGLQTTGNGHIIRSTPVIAGLKARGHDVLTLLSGPSLDGRWDPGQFAPIEVRRGLTFVHEAGRIRYLKTGGQLQLLRFASEVEQFRPFDFDLVVTDYEPVSARIARIRGIPSIGLGHLYAFQHKVPVAGGNLLTRMVMTKFAPTDVALGMHWHHFGQPLLPPAVSGDLPQPETPVQDLILVYMPFEDIDAVCDLLREFGDYRFHMYTRVDAEQRRANIRLRPVGRADFLADLARCNGVMSNAGFTLLSEALHLGKKIVAEPLLGQVEQTSNAAALEQLGLGATMYELDAARIRSWLSAPALAPMRYPDVQAAIVDWIDRGMTPGPEQFAAGLWAQANLDD
jgi:uncharacterized protein (TIGR00661 family)